MQKAIIRLSSVTYAIRAQKLLEQSGIRSVIKKLARSLQVTGCGYGLEINTLDVNAAVAVLNASGIRILEVMR